MNSVNDNIEFMNLSDRDKKNYILQTEVSGQYKFNEEKRMELLGYITDESEVYSVAITLSDNNKVSDAVLAKFDRNSFNLGNLLKTVNNVEDLKKGLKYYAFDYSKPEIINQDKYDFKTRLELIEFIDNISYRMQVIDTITDNNLLKEALNYFKNEYYQTNIINRITDINFKIELAKELSDESYRYGIFKTLEIAEQLNNIGSFNLSEQHKKEFILGDNESGQYKFNEEKRIELLGYIKDESEVYNVAITLSDNNKVSDAVLAKFDRNSFNLGNLLKTVNNVEDLKKGLNYYAFDYSKTEIINQDKYDFKTRLELIEFIDNPSYRMQVIDTITDNNLLKEALKYFESESYQVKIINRITDINSKIELAKELSDESYRYGIFKTLEIAEQLNNIGSFNLSEQHKKEFILGENESGQYKFNEEKRIELLSYITDESEVYNVAITLSDNNKVSDAVLAKFDRNSFNLGNLLKTVNNVEDLKKGLKYYAFDYSKTEIINQDKYDFKTRLELIEFIDSTSYRMQVIDTITDNNLLKEALNYFEGESYQVKIINRITDINSKIELAKKLSDESYRYGIFKTLEIAEQLNNISSFNLNDDHKQEIAVIKDETGKYIFSEKTRFEIVGLIVNRYYRMQVVDTITDNNLLKEALKYFESESYQASIINRITDVELQKQIAISQIGLIKDIYKIKSYISNFSEDLQGHLLLRLNDLIEMEKYMLNISNSQTFNEEFAKIKEFGLKYRILTSSSNNISDDSRLMFLNEFEEEDRLKIISKMSKDINIINGYNQNPFKEEKNKMSYIRLLTDESKITQLDILDNDIDKLTVISKFKSIELKHIALDKVQNYQITFKKLFGEGDYKLISNFDDNILIPIFDSKQMKILHEYRKYTRESIREHFSKYVHEHYDTLDEDNISTIANLIFRVDTSNSEEVSKQADAFLDSILSSDDPMASFEKIEKIFLKNHLPYFAKVYLTFLTVHPDFKSYKFKNSNNGNHYVTSPVLNENSLLHKKVLSFTDLMKCNLGSNNLNFLDYLNKLEYGNLLYLKYKNSPQLQMNENDYNILVEFRDCLFAIYDNSLLAKSLNQTNNIIDDISKIDTLFSKTYGNSYSLADRVISSYCHFIGINTVNEARVYMKKQIDDANKRNTERYENKDFKIEQGDFIKSFDINYFFEMMQDGIVAKDYLGADMTTDGTALDTDLSRIWKDTTDLSIQDIIDLKDKDSGYFGQAYMVVKDNPETINITKVSNNESYSRCDTVRKSEIFGNKLESFSNGTGYNISNPYGIRTGFSSSEISFIVFDEKGGVYKDNLYKLILPMVMNGLYIPIISKDKEKVLFSLEDYNKLREKMNGLRHYGINNYQLSNNIDSEAYRKIASEIDDSNKMITETKNKISELIKESLDGEFEIIPYINGKLSSNELQVLDTGSTSRSTNIPYDGDYDYVIRINREIDIDDEKKKKFTQKIVSKFDIVDNGRIVDGDIKEMVIRIDGKEYNLDLSFTRKTDKVSYSTEMCVADRLDTIKQQYPDKYKLVLANIIFAKQFFKDKENECYKKGHYGQGGLGGIGVENWILQNGGSFYDAAIDFISNAYDENGNIISFDDFKKKYQIWDFGENFYTDRKNQHYSSKYNLHDNFISNNLTKEGYEKICKALKKFISNYELYVNNQSYSVGKAK